MKITQLFQLAAPLDKLGRWRSNVLLKRKHATEGTSNRSREHWLNDISRAAVDPAIALRDRAETTGPRNDGSLNWCTTAPLSAVYSRRCISATFRSSTDWLHVRDGQSSAGSVVSTKGSLLYISLVMFVRLTICYSILDIPVATRVYSTVISDLPVECVSSNRRQRLKILRRKKTQKQLHWKLHKCTQLGA